MKNEVNWHDVGSGISNFMQGIRGQPPASAKPTPPPAPNVTAPEDDPSVRQSKFSKFAGELEHQFFSVVPIKDQAKSMVERSLRNIAKSMTLGLQIYGRDVDEILLAIHSSQDVDDKIKLHTFRDHYGVMSFIRQVFDHTPAVWYKTSNNPDERLPPGTTFNSEEFKALSNHWQNSPFKTKHIDPDQVKAGKAKFGSGEEIIEWMLETFAQKVPGYKQDELHPIGINLNIDQWVELAEAIAKASGVALDPQDLARLKAIAQ